MLKGGQEVIVGAVTDGSFGKLVAFGLGGVLVEVLKDITFRLAPATQGDALSMLDGIQAAEMLKGVRGGDAGEPRGARQPDRRRQRAGQRLPRDLRDGPEPGLRDARTARSPPTCASSSTSRRSRARYRPPEADVVTSMNRIMQPKAVAVIGASDETGKIGNSVMKNLINGGYKGQIYPIHPKAAEIMGYKAYKSVKDVPGRDRHRGVRDPRQVRRRRADRVRREEDRRRHADPVGLRRDRQRRGPGRAGRDRPQVQHPPDGAEHLRLLLHAGQPVRHVLHRLRRQGLDGAVVAVGRHRHGDHRLLALGQDGRVGDRRPRQQVATSTRTTCCSSSSRTRTPRSSPSTART